DRLLPFIFERFVQSGTLRVTTASGRTFTLGAGPATPPAARFPSNAAQRWVLLDPELRLGEAYMNGTFVVEQGSIADLLAILLRQEHIAAPTWALPGRLV